MSRWLVFGTPFYVAMGRKCESGVKFVLRAKNMHYRAQILFSGRKPRHTGRKSYFPGENREITVRGVATIPPLPKQFIQTRLLLLNFHNIQRLELPLLDAVD